MSDSTNILSRRTVLQGTGAAVAAGTALSACGDSEPSGAEGTGATDPGSGGPSASAAADLGASSDVPVGGGKIYPDAKVVVTQPTAGAFKAFSTTCPHKGCAVSAVTKDGISCPCHGSLFAVADGAPTQGPATEPLAGKTVTVADGKLSIT